MKVAFGVDNGFGVAKKISERWIFSKRWICSESNYWQRIYGFPVRWKNKFFLTNAVKISGFEPIAATQCFASPWNVNMKSTATTARGSGAAMKRMRSSTTLSNNSGAEKELVDRMRKREDQRSHSDKNLNLDTLV